MADAQRAAVAARLARPWVLQVDITKFFDQIRRDDVRLLVRKNVRSKVIADLLCNAIDCELEDTGGRGLAVAIASGIKKGVGLRQGMPVSPMLSNLLLKRFDNEIIKSGIMALRYADDLAIFAGSKSACDEALEAIRGKLAFLGLKVPELTEKGKTIISGPSEDVSFLGVIIRRFDNEYRICAPFKNIPTIEETMSKSISIAECLKLRKNLTQVAKYLESFVIGHSAAVAIASDRDEFTKRLFSAKEKCLARFLNELFGKDVVKGLDPERKAILGIGPFSR